MFGSLRNSWKICHVLGKRRYRRSGFGGATYHTILVRSGHRTTALGLVQIQPNVRDDKKTRAPPIVFETFWTVGNQILWALLRDALNSNDNLRSFEFHSDIAAPFSASPNALICPTERVRNRSSCTQTDIW